MAIEIQQKQRKNPLPAIIGVIIILAVGSWFVINFLKPGDLFRPPKVEEVLPSSESVRLMKAGLNVNNILSNPIFQTISPHITWPMPVIPLGRPNPFQPF